MKKPLLSFSHFFNLIFVHSYDCNFAEICLSGARKVDCKTRDKTQHLSKQRFANHNENNKKYTMYLGVKKIMSFEVNPYWKANWSCFLPSSMNKIYKIDERKKMEIQVNAPFNNSQTLLSKWLQVFSLVVIVTKTAIKSECSLNKQLVNFTKENIGRQWGSGKQTYQGSWFYC